MESTKKQIEFVPFPKMARLSREITITEKIDGTCSVVYIGEDGEFLVGSRTKWIDQSCDNHGFAKWAYAHKDELMKLGAGRHYGEFWGCGIQRGYNMKEKHFSLFNTTRWSDPNVRPSCCDVVPVLYQGMFDMQKVEECLEMLRRYGSKASPDFMKPEGIVVFHSASNMCFKKTLEKDEVPKSLQK